MGKKLSIILAILVTITIIASVVLYTGSLIQNEIEKADATKIYEFILLNKSYSDSTGILTLDLQNVGCPLESIAKEDFFWYMENHNKNPIYSIDFVDGKNFRVENGDIVQIKLRVGRVSSGTKIKLTYRGGFQIVVTIP